MCEFFSFVHDGKKIYYFDSDQRKNGVKMPDGNKIGSYDSHSSITCYYRLDDDGVNKFEYNPYTDKLVLDGKTICEWDEKTIREQLAGIDWKPIAGDVEGAREFLRGLKDIPWFKPDGTVEDSEEIKLFETWDAARDAARDAAYYCLIFYLCGDLQIDEKHRAYIRKRFEIWQNGYGVYCDVNGIFYAYKKI